MPSPIGHALAGVAAGWLVTRPIPRAAGASRLVPWLQPLAFGAAATLPDVDLAFGLHSGPTHGLGAALMFGLAVLALAGTRAGARFAAPLAGAWPGPVAPGPARVRLAAAMALAYATHTLLDWMGNDTTPPIGIMALWPFSAEYYQSDLYVFMAISRRYWLPGFWTHNVTAVARETAVLAPVVVAVWMLRRPRTQDA